MTSRLQKAVDDIISRKGSSSVYIKAIELDELIIGDRVAEAQQVLQLFGINVGLQLWTEITDLIDALSKLDLRLSYVRNDYCVITASSAPTIYYRYRDAIFESCMDKLGIPPKTINGFEY